MVAAEAEAAAHLCEDRSQELRAGTNNEPEKQDETAQRVTEAEKKIIELEHQLAQSETARQKVVVDSEHRIKQLQQKTTQHEIELCQRNIELAKLRDDLSQSQGSRWERSIRSALDRWTERSSAETRAVELCAAQAAPHHIWKHCTLFSSTAPYFAAPYLAAPHHIWHCT